MAKKTAPVEEVEDDEVELEDLDEAADEEEAPPAKKGTKAKAKPAKEEVDHGFGVRALIALIKEKTGKEYNPREVRTLLRKLAREDGTIDREIIAGNKSRYVWDGPNDPEVKAVLKAVKGGAIEDAKKAALAKLKSDKAAKTAAAEAKPAAKKKPKPAPEPDEDEDEDEDD